MESYKMITKKEKISKTCDEYSQAGADESLTDSRRHGFDGKSLQKF